MWDHIAATFDGNTRALWLNGHLLVSDTPFGHNVAANNFAVGKTVGNEYFSGQLDDVRIYNRALSLGEIQSLALITVPEPTSFSLIALGGALFTLLRRRRRRLG